MASPTSHCAKRRALGPIVLACVAALLAGCGGSSSNGGVAHLGSSTGSNIASAETGGSGEKDPAQAQKAMVAYARCMRSHGVASFPEPTEGHIEIKSSQRVGGGGSISSNGVNPESAAFQTADKTCRKLLPNGGTPSPQQVAKAQEGALNFSRCMRSHGVPGFPNPKFSGGTISMKVGGPGLDASSPQFQAAQKACNGKLGPGGKGAVPGGGGGGRPAPNPGGGGGSSESGVALAAP